MLRKQPLSRLPIRRFADLLGTEYLCQKQGQSALIDGRDHEQLAAQRPEIACARPVREEPGEKDVDGALVKQTKTARRDTYVDVKLVKVDAVKSLREREQRAYLVASTERPAACPAQGPPAAGRLDARQAAPLSRATTARPVP